MKYLLSLLSLAAALVSGIVPPFAPNIAPTAAAAAASAPASPPTGSVYHGLVATPVPGATPAAPIPAPDPTAVAGHAALPGAAWNVALVGHHPLADLGWWTTMALCDTCAYVGSYTRANVPIVDVSDPTRPLHVGGIALPAGARPVEVRALPERDLLVINDDYHARLYIYDVSDCARPRLLGVHQLPGAAHEFFLWHQDGRVLAFAALFDEGPPDLVVVDLTAPALPAEVGRWSRGDDGVAGLLHSLSVSPAGDRAYLSLWDGGLLVLDVDLPALAARRDASGRLARVAFANTHSAVPLGDPRYVVLASEIFTCPFAGLALVDLADPTRPRIVSEFLLPENTCAGLPPGGPTFTPHNPTTVGDWVITSWYGAGLQLIDWTDRAAPVRIGQYVPAAGDAAGSFLGAYPVQTFSYPIVSHGLIYFVDSVSGLYVTRYTGPGADQFAAVTRAEGNLTVRP